MFPRFCLCLLLAVSLHGQASSKEFSRKEIEATWGDYNQAFISKDYAKLRELLQVPFVRWNDRETTSLQNMDDLIASYKRNREALDPRGYQTSRAAFADAKISVLSPSRILLNISYRRYKTDGSVLEEGAGFYLMSKASGRWKIQGILTQDAAEIGKLH